MFVQQEWCRVPRSEDLVQKVFSTRKYIYFFFFEQKLKRSKVCNRTCTFQQEGNINKQMHKCFQFIHTNNWSLNISRQHPSSFFSQFLSPSFYFHIFNMMHQSSVYLNSIRPIFCHFFTPFGQYTGHKHLDFTFVTCPSPCFTCQ